MSTIKVHEDGRIEFTKEQIKILMRVSGIKSRKKRIVKKVIKRLISQAIIEYIEKREQQRQ